MKNNVLLLFMLSILYCGFVYGSSGETNPAFPDSSGRLIIVSNSSQFKSAVQNALAGDIIEILNGKYDTDGMTMYSSGTVENPIIIRARNTGEAELGGESYFDLRKSAYVTIQGLLFTSSAYTVIKLEACHHIRITQNIFRLTEYESAKWVLVGGIWNDPSAISHHNRIDHNLFEEKHQLGNFITIDGSPDPVYQSSQYDRIDHNHFRNIGPRAVNEMEAVRIGWSELSMSHGFTTVEYNLFENCDGDPEIVSVKTCSDTIRHNTFVKCQGSLSLRHGNGSVVNGNFFLGRNKVGTGGIRIYGDDHIVYNNYFEGLTGTNWDAAITLTNGDYDSGSSLSKHFRINRAKILHNTLVDNLHNIEIGFTNNGSYSKPPRDVQIINNIVWGRENQLVKIITEPVNMIWEHNIFFPDSNATLGMDNMTDEQIRVANPLMRFTDSLYKIDVGSPAIDYNNSGISFIAYDMDGQPRDDRPDTGADEYADSEILIKPVTPDMVGPFSDDNVSQIKWHQNQVEKEKNIIQASPNPFNSVTVFIFNTSGSRPIKLDIFDLSGKHVTTLINRNMPSGTHRITWDAHDMASGMYIYRFDQDRNLSYGRLILIR